MLTTFKMVTQPFLHKENKKFSSSHLPLTNHPFSILLILSSIVILPSTPVLQGSCITGVKIFLIYLQLFPFPMFMVMPLLPWRKEQNLPLKLCISKYFWLCCFYHPTQQCHRKNSQSWYINEWTRLFPINLHRSRWPSWAVVRWLFTFFISPVTTPPFFPQWAFLEKIVILTVSRFCPQFYATELCCQTPIPHFPKISWQEWLFHWVIMGVLVIWGLAIFWLLFGIWGTTYPWFSSSHQCFFLVSLL